MSDFVAFFPSQDNPFQPPPSFALLNTIFRDFLHPDTVHSNVIDGASLLVSESTDQKLAFYAKADGSGWIIIKGVIFDVRNSEPYLDLSILLNYFINGETDKFVHYEGTFALAAWDATNRRGWIMNDQASTLNLYYTEGDDGFYVTTNALSLARALGLTLNPHSVQEFLLRKNLLAPSSMFDGLYRVDVGEHISYKMKKTSHGKHWYVYSPESNTSKISEAAAAMAEVITDRFSRYAAVANPVLCDLTGGYDSRLLACAAEAAQIPFSVTVNGPSDFDDVIIANLVAKKMNWPMKYFDTPLFWTTEVTPEIRKELTYRLSGELPFNEIYHHLFSRPLLAQEFNLHVIGVGGGLLRYLPWSQEFFNIGRYRVANIDNILNYRYIPEKRPPSTLFLQDWLPDIKTRLRAHIEAICLEQPGSRNTQQLDAVHTWKMTSHSSLYLSAVYNWLPSVSPFQTAGVINAAVAVPWKMRLTSQFQRHVIHHLSPTAAHIITTYGGNAAPMKLNNLHLEAWQFVRRTGKLARKLDGMLLKGTFSKRMNLVKPSPKSEKIPFLTPEFRGFLNPQNMFSKGMYNFEGLQHALGGNDEDWQKQIPLILKLATIEELCRELNFKPEADFLGSTPTKPIPH